MSSRSVSVPVELSANRAGIGDRAAQRQQRAVVDGHRARARLGWDLAELKIVRCEGRRMHAMQRDRLPVAEGDYGIAITVLGEVAVDVREA